MLRMKIPQHDRRRSAMTLIEVLVVVVLSSLVMGVVISFTVALQRSDRNVRSFAVRIDRLNELASALRSDLRQAEDASLESAKKLAIKFGSGREIQYELADRGCLRVVAAEDDLPPVREYFAVGAAEKWQLERETGGRRPLVMVTMQFAERDKTDESRPRRWLYEQRWAPIWRRSSHPRRCRTERNLSRNYKTVNRRKQREQRKMKLTSSAASASSCVKQSSIGFRTLITTNPR